MKTFITSMAVAMLLAVTANADVIHSNDYEADGAAQGTGLGIQPASMDFTDGGGDFVGQPALGLSSTSANGSFSYVIDTSQSNRLDGTNGSNWGGSWSGINSNSGIGSGGFFPDAASAIAAGPGSQYIDLTIPGTTFTVSANAATDANGVTGGTVFAPRLEIQGAAGELFRNDSGQVAGSSLTTTFQPFTHSYTLTAADVALGIDRVTGTLGVDGLGVLDTAGGGNIYYDDFLFEVSGPGVITVAAVPEPATATLLLGGLMGLCGVRRRKS